MKLSLHRKPPSSVRWGLADSEAGQLVIGLSETGAICRLAFIGAQKPAEIIDGWQAAWPRTDFIAGADVTAFRKMAIALTGTLFQHAVWQDMATIEAGATASYGAIARRIGKPQAARAVGAACGANPVPYLVPCHRVVASSGHLTGFSGGLDVKQRLLKAEGYL